MPIAGMREDLDWIGNNREMSMLMDRCYLFEKVGTEKVAQGGRYLAGGGAYDVVVWGAIPLDIAVQQFINPPKHQIRPLSKQPAFVKKHVALLRERGKVE